MSDADSVALHQNLASRIFSSGLSDINIIKNVEFSLLSNTEFLLIFSPLLKSDNFGSQLNFVTFFIHNILL